MSEGRTDLERIHPTNETSLQTGYHRAAEYLDDHEHGYGELDADPKVDFAKWRDAIFRRKWLILAVVFIITLAVTIEMYRNRSMYQASTVMEVGKDDKALVKSLDLLTQEEESLRTKMFILQSTPLLEDVVVSLKLDQNPTFYADFDQVNVNFKKRPIGETMHRIVERFILQKPELLPAQSAIETRIPVQAAKTVRPPEVREKLEPYVKILKTNMAVEAVLDTRLLKVSFTHPDPTLAAVVTNGIAQCFIQRNFEGKSMRSAQASGWLESTTKDLKQKVEQAEESLARYTRDHDIFSTEGKRSLIVEKLAHLHGEVTRAESDRMLKQSLYEEVKRGRGAQIPEAFTDPKTVELKKKLGELSVKIAQLGVNYGPDNPQIIEAQQEMTAVQKEVDLNQKTLEEKLQADYERALRDEGAFKSAFAQAKTEAVQENQDAIQYNILQQEVETNKTLYKDFLQKTNQANFEVAQQYIDTRVIEPARVPKTVSTPARRQWMMIGFVLSFVAGIGLAVLLEYVDKSVRNVEDVSRQLQLPALAVIPKITTKRPRLLKAKNGKRKTLSVVTPAAKPVRGQNEAAQSRGMPLDSRSPAAEAYRLLRTSVVLSFENNAAKTMLITSSRPGEGKTTTTINTAISLAQLGSSVLIIDCDLRTPMIQKALGFTQEFGLSTYLSSEVELDGLVRALQIPGLSVLPSGPIPHNPAELLGSKKMKDMLSLLAKRYDHILIDSPPLVNLADAVILSTLADGVILVVHGGKVSREVVVRARHELSTVGAKILGVVLNNIETRSGRYGGYYA